MYIVRTLLLGISFPSDTNDSYYNDYDDYHTYHYPDHQSYWHSRCKQQQKQQQ